MRSYRFLEDVLRKVRNIENILKLLGKSQLNVEDKIEQVCLLEEIKHEIISHDIIKESLAKALRNKKSVNVQQLKLIKEIHKSNSVIPVDLIKSLSKAKIECQNLWRLTNSEISNLEKLKECFTNLIKLTREAASIKSQQLKRSNYESLLADRDYNITEKNIKEIFPRLGKFFSENIEKIIQKQKKNKVIGIQKVAVQRQIELSSLFLQQMSITPNEISISYYDDPIDYDESDLCHGLFLLLRHTGYAIHQKCLMQNFIKSSTTKHIMCETQGLLMEKIIGTSREFVEFIQPHIKEKLSTKGKINSSVENLYSIFNKINLSSFLKNADEFSLLAHIMLRTKLEQDLINGTLEVKDLHDKWLEGMKHYKISVKAKNELDTYFQDEYWISGIIGYFPIKVIALVAAVQFFSFIKKNHYEFLDSIVRGDFSLLIKWFSKNVYSGNCDFLEQLKKVTGRNLDIECYTNYLSEKYNLFE